MARNNVSSADILFPSISSKLTDISKAYNHKNNCLNPKTKFRQLFKSEVGKNPKVKLTGNVKLHGVHPDIVVSHDDQIWFRSRR